MKLLRKLTKKRFVKNVMVVATGTVAAQAISLILQPIITRIYGPEAYGVMGVFIALISILGPVSALTFPIAIILPKSDKEANQLIRLSLFITISFAVLLTLILLFFSDFIITIFNFNEISSFIYLIPIVVIFAGLYQIMEQWLIRTKQFKEYAKVTFIHMLLLQGSKVGIGLFHPFAVVLIVLTTVGEALRTILMLMIDKKLNLRDILKMNNNNESLNTLFKKYKDFPLFRAPQTFINAVSQNLPILLLTSFFGPASAGFYAIGRTVLNLPTQLIGKSVGDVFYPRISEAKNNGEDLYGLLKKATLALVFIGILPFSLVVILGPQLFGFVFGEEWLTAGEYARWIALWLFFMFISQPSTKAIPVLDMQAYQLKYSIITLFIRTIALAIGYFGFSSDVIAIALFGISGAIRTLSLTLITMKKSKLQSL